MLFTFRKFVGFKILEHFLFYPTEEIYLNEIARKLRISSGSAKRYCDLFVKEKIIKREKKGNLHTFWLNNDDFCVREMKRAYISLLLKEVGIEKASATAISVAIYGSYASGEYDEKSDVDLLVIGEEKNVNRKLIVEISGKIGREIQLTVIPPFKWERMKEEDHFAKSVLRKYILIRGAEL